MTLKGENAVADHLDATAQRLADDLAAANATNEMLTTALVEANDQLLGLYTMARFSPEALDLEAMLRVLAERIRAIAGAAGVGIRCPELDPLLDGNVSTHPALADLLSSGQPSGIHRAEAIGWDYDIVLKRGDSVAFAAAGAPGLHWGTPTMKLLEALFATAEGFVGLSRMHQRAKTHAIVQHDANAAAGLAALVLPQTVPTIPGVEIAARCDPARLGAGDFFCWSPTADGIVFAVGDVAGKGLGAAVVMTLMAETVQEMTRQENSTDPSLILHRVNKYRSEYLHRTGLFVTLAVGAWSGTRKQIQIANAGHSPVCVRQGNSIAYVPASAPPVGIIDEILPSAEVFDLGPGDHVVFGSDGLVEEEASDGSQFGYDAFADLVAAGRDLRASEMVQHLFTAVTQFGDGDPDDDRTALVLRRNIDGEDQSWLN